MKVLKEGTVSSTWQGEVKCPKCEAIIRYGRDDLCYKFEHGRGYASRLKMVFCRICGEFILEDKSPFNVDVLPIMNEYEMWQQFESYKSKPKSSCIRFLSRRLWNFLIHPNQREVSL